MTADGSSIVRTSPKILEGFWAAKLEEGKKGSRTGACSFTGTEGEVISAYCKAWPWAFPTWSCPLPHGGDETMISETVALSPETYRAPDARGVRLQPAHKSRQLPGVVPDSFRRPIQGSGRIRLWRGS